MDKTIEDKINIYRVKKSAQYIVYNCYGSNYGDDAFTIDYLNLFREIIKHLAEDEALIDKVVNNINEYLVKQEI